jgi:hypothetical protein
MRAERDSTRSLQEQAPEKGVGAIGASGFLSWSMPHELQPCRRLCSAAVLSQPGRQVGGAAEIEQRLGQGLQLR